MRARIILAFVLLAAVSLSAQTFRGTILGTVTDAQGAVVPGAKVTVKNVGTGLERTTETSADGSYALPELPIGTYTVTIALTGFQTAVTSGVTVDVATERRVDAAMKPGEVSTRVEVAGDLLPQVETTTNDLGGVITQETVKDLPVNGRDYTKLIYLNPGVAGSPDEISDSPGSFGEFSMNGARGRSNNYLLDGTDMNARHDFAPRCSRRSTRDLQLSAGIWAQRGRRSQYRNQERNQPDTRKRRRVFPQ